MEDQLDTSQETGVSVRGLTRALLPRSRLSRGAPRTSSSSETFSPLEAAASLSRRNSLIPSTPASPATSSSAPAISGDCEATTSSDDAVKVVVRVRPLNERETSFSDAAPVGVVTATPENNTIVLSDPGRQEPYAVAVDCALGEDSTQFDVYAAVGAAMVDHCMAGFNSTIFAYGQTGSGKTHTMLGEVAREGDGALDPRCGLTPRVFEALFAAIARREQTAAGRESNNNDCDAETDSSSGGGGGGNTLRYSVKCSFLEIYNEEVTDLLAPGSTGLQVRDGDVKRGVYVQGLSETEVLNADDVLGVIAAGSENRREAATRMNERSSRSHSVFTATIEAHERTPSGIVNVRYAKLNLIDLAGSERVGRSGATGDQLTEARSINRSLTVLGRVISALVERQKRPAVHIPYRDSRLTFLLQESLGGNSRTAIVATVTPAVDSAFETYSTLAFAAGAKKIKCRAVVNEDRVADAKALSAENARLSRLVEELSSRPPAEETESLRRQLEQAQALFDQNNTAIANLTAEQGVLRRQLGEASSAAGRLGEEAVTLRADNAAMAHALESAAEEVGRLRQELSVVSEERAAHATAALTAQEAEKDLGEEVARLRHEVKEARDGAAKVAAEVQELHTGRAAAEAMLEEARIEVRRVQKEAREESAAAAAREEGLRREAETARQRMLELAEQAQGLQKELSGESSSVAKYRRMVGEIGRLIDWAQASAPGSAAAAAALSAARAKGKAPPGAKPSPAAAAALRVARMSLAGGAPLGDATNIGGGGGRAAATPGVRAG